MKRYVCALVIVSIFLPALARAEELSDPEKNFEFFWKSLEQRYVLFLLLCLDWNLLYCVY